MATHSSILAWRIPMDRGPWQATVHRVARVRHDLVTKPPPLPLHVEFETHPPCTQARAHTHTHIVIKGEEKTET